MITTSLIAILVFLIVAVHSDDKLDLLSGASFIPVHNNQLESYCELFPKHKSEESSPMTLPIGTSVAITQTHCQKRFIVPPYDRKDGKYLHIRMDLPENLEKQLRPILAFGKQEFPSLVFSDQSPKSEGINTNKPLILQHGMHDQNGIAELFFSLSWLEVFLWQRIPES